MQVTCHICERSINVPEEKLPENQVVHLTCPGCRGKIRIDQHIKAEPRNPEKSPEPEPKEDVSPELEAESPGLV
ncbi:MAG: hypothetical protein GWO19_00285, partial [Nitrospinaceae bacterium]|nr:hypothetical protein [Nitrospinaceae bacterium]NIR53251.1 hypothetical protein [Nitrospinaceae bacterium]NIS83649.1 hypothetical protein [Nitrospinaceae bacterium]NIU42776.1 hypothetical protein [Nitrospinaceae bacterium]NIU94840.1 hypothetical protein [Nitrospinaceae bacterium]